MTGPAFHAEGLLLKDRQKIESLGVSILVEIIDGKDVTDSSRRIYFDALVSEAARLLNKWHRAAILRKTRQSFLVVLDTPEHRDEVFLPLQQRLVVVKVDGVDCLMLIYKSSEKRKSKNAAQNFHQPDPDSDSNLNSSVESNDKWFRALLKKNSLVRGRNTLALPCFPSSS